MFKLFTISLFLSACIVRPWETSSRKYVTSSNIASKTVTPSVSQSIQQDCHLQLFPFDENCNQPKDNKSTSTDRTPTRHKIKKSRHLSPKALDMMESWYSQHFHHPYPSEDIVCYIVKHGHVTATQVKKWMANKRVRSSNTLAFNGTIHPKRLRRLTKQIADESQIRTHHKYHHQPYRYPHRPTPRHPEQIQPSYIENQTKYFTKHQKYPTHYRYNYQYVSNVNSQHYMSNLIPGSGIRTR